MFTCIVETALLPQARLRVVTRLVTATCSDADATFCKGAAKTTMDVRTVHMFNRAEAT
eukprot:COSAG01_NODE_52300_length_347_cov_1.451613_1_plen_57_part_01